MVNPKPVGQVWPTKPWHLAHGPPHRLGNLAVGKQLQLIMLFLPGYQIPKPYMAGLGFGHMPFLSPTSLPDSARLGPDCPP